MPERLRTISPVDGRVVAERPLADAAAIGALLEGSRRGARSWRAVPLAERAACCSRFVERFASRRQAIAEEISWQMGRPIAHSPGEVAGLEERALAMIELAPGALADVRPPPRPGFERRIAREPLGVVLTIAPWNYPYLTAVNSVVPAILAGNAVVLRHSAQTPLCAERFAEAFAEAGLPEGVFQVLHCSHDAVLRLVAGAGIDHVAFTGSVEAGRAVQRAAAERFIGVGLELGGKDPAYVRADADLGRAVEGLVDGAFFNAGQSCCGIERIYVDAALHDDFVEAFCQAVRRYRLGDPLDPETTLGPLVRTAAADRVREQVAAAVAAGARALLDPREFPAAAEGTPYLAPQVLVDVDHSMGVMTEESFGPVVGIMPVADDDEAVERMNDSAFGLSACVFSEDLDAAGRIGERIETGTFFLNRCDYLDPWLAWTGVKDSGRGQTLSRLGLEALTRPKSYHLRR